MIKSEALSLAKRLLEHAWPETEILIKAVALDALVNAASYVHDGLPQNVTAMRAVLERTNPTSITLTDGKRFSPVDFDALQILRLLGELYLATLPTTKMVNVYYIHWASSDGKPQIDLRQNMEDAQARANYLLQDCGSKCVSVTGPHQQMVQS